MNHLRQTEAERDEAELELALMRGGIPELLKTARRQRQRYQDERDGLKLILANQSFTRKRMRHDSG